MPALQRSGIAPIRWTLEVAAKEAAVDVDEKALEQVDPAMSPYRYSASETKSV
jgi:hypothetical protein